MLRWGRMCCCFLPKYGCYSANTRTRNSIFDNRKIVHVSVYCWVIFFSLWNLILMLLFFARRKCEQLNPIGSSLMFGLFFFVLSWKMKAYASKKWNMIKTGVYWFSNSWVILLYIVSSLGLTKGINGYQLELLIYIRYCWVYCLFRIPNRKWDYVQTLVKTIILQTCMIQRIVYL